MSSNDTRVVEMQFKNKEFEKNIETSQKSLEKFKKELDFEETSRGVEKFGRSMESLNFAKMADNIQKLTDKFTGLGTVSEFIMSKIRGSLEEAANSALRFSKSLTFDQIDEGKQKFEELNKSTKTIMAATGKSEEEVNAQLERLNKYTDWTSYSFSDMASNIGKFTSVGIPLEQAEKQMEGIANWAARSGAGIQEASRAMYNLSQSMGMGKLNLMDWKSIENAGMGTKEFKEQMIEAGLAAGTLVAEVKKSSDGTEQIVYKTSKKFGKQVEVNYKNFRETLSKGWADTTVVGNTLMGYYYEDLEMENEEGMQQLNDDQKKMFNDMFKRNGKIDKTGWQKVVKEGLDTDELKQKMLDTAEAYGTLTVEVGKDGQKIYKTVDTTGKTIEFTLDTFEKGLGGNWLTRNVAKTAYAFDDLAKGSYEAAMKCLSFTDVLNAWKDMISTGWMASFRHIFGDMTESIQIFSAICNKVGDSFSAIFGVDGTINKVLAIWENAGGRESLWSTILGETDDPDSDDKLFEGAYGLVDVIKDIGGMISGAFWDFMKDIASTFYSEDELADWEENSEFRIQFLGYRIKDFTDKIKNFVGSIKDFFHEIPEGASQSRWDTIKNVIKSVFSVISLAAQTVGGIFTFIGKIKKQLEPSIKAITGMFYSLTQGIVGSEQNLRKSGAIKNFFVKLAEVLTPITKIINRVVVGITRLISSFVKWGKESGFFLKVWQTIKNVITGISGFIDKASDALSGFFKKIGSTFSILFKKGISKETLKEAGGVLIGAFKDVFDSLKGKAPELWGKVKEFFGRVFNVSGKALSGVGGKGSGILAAVKKVLQSVFGGIADLFSNLTDKFGDGSMMGVFKAILGGGFGLIADIIGKLRELLSGVSLYDMIWIFLGGMAIFKLIGVLGSVKKMFKSFSGIAESISGIFDGIKERIAGKENSADEKFLNIAKGIAIIAAAIIVLGKMRWQDALQGGLVIIGIMGTMMLFIWALGKVMKKMKASDVLKMVGAVMGLGAGLAILAVGMFILIRAIKPLASMKLEGLIKMLAGLGVILFMLSKFASSMKDTKIDAKSMAAVSLLAIGIGIMVIALKPLAKMNWGQLGKMGASLAVILLMLAAFSRIVGNIDGKGVGQVGLLALGIGVMVIALIPLANMNWTQLGKMGASLGVILLLLSGFSHIMGSMKDKGLGGSIALALAIVILVKALLPLASMSLKGLIKMAAGLGVILFMLAKFSKGLESIKGKGLFGTILLATGILILMEAIKPLAKYDWTQLGKMAAGLGGVLLMLALFSRMFGRIKITSMVGVLLLVGSIALIFEILKPLASYNWEQLGKMGAALGGVLLMLVLFSKMVGGIGIVDMVGILVIVGSIALLLEVLKPIANFAWDQIAKMAVGMIALIASMALMMLMISKINVKLTKLVTLLAFTVAITFIMHEFTVALKKTKDIKWESMLSFAAGLSIMMIAMAAAIVLLSKIDFTKGIKAIALLAAALAAIAVIAPMLGAGIGQAISTVAASLSEVGVMLAYFSSKMGEVSEDNIAKAERVIKKLADIIKDLYGMSSHSGDLKAFSVGLWEISVALSDFHSLTKDIKLPSANGAIGILEYFKQTNGSFSSITFGEFPMSIATLGAGLWLFNDMTKDIPSSANGQKLPSVQLLEAIIGLKDSMAGYAQLYNFGISVGVLGAGLDAFFDSDSSVPTNPDDDPKLKVLKAFSESAEGIKTLMSLNLDDLGRQLGDLGGGMALYAAGATKVAKLGEPVELDNGLLAEVPNVSTAIGILRSVVTEMNALAAENGGEFKYPALPDSEQSNDFGVKLAALAGGLETFINACNGINGKTQLGLDAIGFLVNINNKLNEKASNNETALDTISIFGNAKVSAWGIAGFGIDLRVLAGGLKEFINASNGISGKTTQALTALGFLVQINEKLTDDAIRTIMFFPKHQITNSQLNAMGNDLVTLASGLRDFCDVQVGDISPQLELLGKMEELNTKLTNAKIDEIYKTVEAYMAPIDTSKLSSSDYKSYVDSVVALTGKEQSPMSLFTFGITELGKALQEFASNIIEKGYFNKEYEEPMKNAQDAIEFFQEQFNKMPTIPRGWITSVLNYSKDLGDLNRPIILLGSALSEFGKQVTKAYEDGNYNIDVVNSSIQGIAALVDAYVGINSALIDLMTWLNLSNRNNNGVGDFATEMLSNVGDLIDGGKAMRYLSKQLNYMIKYMTDTEFSGIDGKSVLDNYMELIGSIRDKMNEMNITDDDVNRVSSAFKTLTDLVSVFHPDNYPQENSVSNYIDFLLNDIHSVLFKDGQSRISDDIHDITTLFESIGNALATIQSITSGYVSPGEESIRQAASDFSLLAETLLESMREYLTKQLDDDTNEWVTTLEGFVHLAEIIQKVAEGFALVNSIPDISGALTSIGTSVAEVIAGGINSKASEDILRNAMKDLIGNTGKSFISDPSWLMGSGSISLMDKVTRKLVANGKIYSNSITEAFKSASASDIMSEFSSVLTDQDSSYSISFTDIGFFMGVMIADGISKSKEVISASITNLMNETGNELMTSLIGETLNLDKLLNVWFEQNEKDLDNLGIDDYLEAITSARTTDSWLKYDSFQDIGYFMSIGIAIGLERGTVLVENSARDVVDKAKLAVMDEAQKIGLVMDGISELLGQESNNISPTITPVVDLTNFNASGIGDLLSGNSQLLGDYSLSLKLETNQFESLKPIDYTDKLNTLSSSLDSLEERVANLSTKLNNLCVVLDSGTMVGALGPKMDVYLGQHGFYASRGMSP